MKYNAQELIEFYENFFDKCEEIDGFWDFLYERDTDSFELFQEEITNSRFDSDVFGDFEVWYGVSKGVFYNSFFPNIVVKIPFLHEVGEDDLDYCQIEERNYQLAVEEGVERFFAPMEYLTTCKGMSLYVMQYANVDTDYVSQSVETYLDETGKTVDWSDRGAQTGELFLEQYLDHEDFLELTKFLNKWSIGDLHEANVGFLEDNSIVLIDYSDYY